jgi:hypothetical protein
MTARWLRSPVTVAGTLALLVYALPLLLGDRYLGLDHSLVLLGMQCALRDFAVEGLALDLSLGGGSPLLGDPQGGVFYPLNWLLVPLGAELAASLYSVAHLALAAAATAWLGRGVGLSQRSSLVLGLAFAFCGTTANLILHGSYIAGAAWLPLVWAGAMRAVRPGRQRAGLLAVALGLAMLLLAGELQGFVVAVGLVALELGRVVAPRWSQRRSHARRWTLVLSALACGLLLGGLQLAPTLGLGSAAARAEGMTGAMEESWPLAMPEALGIVWPGIVHRRVTPGATLANVWQGRGELKPPWNTTPYLGLTALCACLAGFVRRQTRRFALVGGLATLMALGAQTPVYGWITWLLPPLQWFRYPSKYFLVASLALLVVAASTLSAAARDPRTRVQLARLLTAAALLSGVAVLVCALRAAAIDAAAEAVAEGIRTLPGVRPDLSALLLRQGLLATGLSAATALLLRRPSAARWAVLMLVLDPLLALPSHVSAGPPFLELESPQAQLGGPDSVQVCPGRGLRALRLDRPELDLGELGTIAPMWINRKANLNQCGGPAVPDHYLASATAPVVSYLRVHLDEDRGYLQPAIAAGCTHLATRSAPGPGLAEQTEPRRPRDDVAAPVYPIVGAMKPVTALEHARLHSDAASSVAAVLGATSTDEILAQLDDPQGALGGDPGAAALTDLQAAEVGLTWSGAHRASIGMTGTGPGVIVLRRPWWPGYRANQGQRSLPILRSAGAQLAIWVDDPSLGPIELHYRPPGLVTGGMSFALGLLFLVLLFSMSTLREPPTHRAS